MTKYELYYFASTGRAEVIRWMFHYAQIPFVDHRILPEEWPKQKGDKSRFPYGTMPVLHVDGHIIAESHVINRFVAKLTKLIPSDPLEAAHLDEVYEVARSFYDTVYPFILIFSDQVPGDKEKGFKEIFIPAIQKYFPLVEQHLKKTGTFSEHGLTYTDFYWATFVDMFYEPAKEIIDKFEKSTALWKKVRALPQLQDYLKNRGY